MDILQQAEAAINGFYHCENAEERNSYHKWLLDLQKSREAWSVSWMLLDPTKRIECQYYGAVILHFKISHMINEITDDDLQKLKTKLLSVMVTFKSLYIVLSKLCATFSALILQIGNEDFKLANFLCDVEIFIRTAGIEPQSIILKLLTELPTQFKFVNMVSSRKLLARMFMNQFIPDLVSTCQNILQCQNSELQLAALDCIIDWVEFGVSIVDCMSIVPILLANLESDELSEKSCDAISELLTAPSSFSLHSTIFIVLNQLLLQVQPQLDKARSDGNREFVENICKLLCDVAETHSNTFIKVTESEEQLIVLNLVKVLLSFSSTPGYFPVDENCSDLPLNFWYALQDDLSLFDLDTFSNYQMQFHEAFLLLIDIYYIKTQYPPSEVFRKYKSDERDQFRSYRIDVQNTIMYLYTALRGRYLNYFTEKLNALISDTSTTWQQTEALLFLLYGTCDMLDTTEEVYIPKIISLMKNIPDHQKVQNTLVCFIGALADWLNSHPTHIPNVLPYLLNGILNSETRASCSISLKNICQECAMLLDESSIKLILQACHKCLQSNNTDSQVMVRIFEICGYVISVLPTNQMNTELEIIVEPLFQLLQTVLQSKQPEVKTANPICECLNCFHGLYVGLDPFEELPVHPITYVYAKMIQMFPLLKPWCSSENVVVAATKCITKAVEIVREKLADYTSVTYEFVFGIFTAYPTSCLLEVAALLIGMFGSVEQTGEVTKKFFTGLLNSGLSLMTNGHEYTDCMKGLMYLLTKAIRTVPEFVFCDVDRQVEFLKCSLVLLSFQETPTIKSTCNFIVTYINHSSVYESGKQLITSLGQQLVCQVLICIGSTAPRHLTDCYAEILLALSKKNPTQLALWFKEVFSQPDFPTKYPTVLQKEQFQKAILVKKLSKSRSRQIVKDFTLVCRGLNGLGYVS